MRKVLIIALLSVLVIGIVACHAPQSILIERDDLIMVNKTSGWDGYAFFFENHPTLTAYTYKVQIRFDASVEKPIVRFAKSGETRVYFRDRDQMTQYWVVR